MKLVKNTQANRKNEKDFEVTMELINELNK